MKFLLRPATVLLGLFALLGAPAAANDTSVSGGFLIQKSGDNTAAVIVTQHLRGHGVRVRGLRTQISAMAPLATGGRYAVTGEVRAAIANRHYLGAGLGYGRLARIGRNGAVYNFIGGTRLARHVFLEGRLYSPITARAGHGGFLGVTYFL